MVFYGGCQCDECVARRVGELVRYAMQLEEAAIEVKRCLERGDLKLAWQISKAVAKEAERRDLNGELEAMVMAQTLETAAEKKAAGRLH